MEKILFPLKYINITQGVNGAYSHQGTYAIDCGWKDEESKKIYAPFTGIIKKIYTKFANVVWLESNDKVEFADGTIDYCTVCFTHDNDVSDLYVGKVINQGDYFYKMGTAGNATGIHVDIQVAKGKFSGTGWYQNQYGIWMLNNSIHPANAFFIKDDTEIKNDYGYAWKKLINLNHYGTPVIRNEEVDQIEITTDILRIRDSANGNIIGLTNPGLYNVYETVNAGNYTWYLIEKGIWVAYSPDWAILYPKKEVAVEEPIIETPVEQPKNDDIDNNVENGSNSNEVPKDSQIDKEDTNDAENGLKQQKNGIFDILINIIKKIIEFLKKEM